MFEQVVTIAGVNWQVYTVALMLASAFTFGWLMLRAPHGKRGATVRVALLLMFAALVLGRVLHVALHWQFFAERPFLIVSLSAEGGINWHGAVIAALLVALPALRHQRLDVSRFLDDLAPVLALVSFAAWRGCASAGCAFGQPVATLAAYPDWLVWLEKDSFRLIEPRFAVQQIGMWVSLALLLLALLLNWRRIARGRQFWIMLALHAGVLFLLGFLRGDPMPMVYSLRADQLLDAVLLGYASVLALRSSNS